MIIIDKMKETIEKFSMLKVGERVLLGVSGGPDSVAMLLLFDSLAKSMRLDLLVAHLNHKLRGRESDDDEKYVLALAKRLKLPVVTERRDVKAFAHSNKLSLEDAARRARYNFFLKTAEDLKIDTIATAHTKDDQAETVLMRILRGTGLKGLRGIPPVRKIGDATLIRPLINVSREDIERYLRAKKIRPRRDKSNLKQRFFRNRIRVQLIPLIKKEYSPRIKDLLSNLTDVLDKDYEYLNRQQDAVFKKIAKIKGRDCIVFPIRPFKREHISIQSSLVRRALEELKGQLDSIDYRHWKEIESLIKNRPAGSIVHLPHGYETVKTKSTLQIRRIDSKKAHLPAHKSVTVRIPGTTYFNRKKIRTRIVECSRSFKRHSKNTEYFDLREIDLPLSLRLRMPGDRMRPFGMKSNKRLKDIFIDEKVPLSQRDKIPLVVSAADEILWVCGVKRSEKGRISAQNKRILRLEILPS